MYSLLFQISLLAFIGIDHILHIEMPLDLKIIKHWELMPLEGEEVTWLKNRWQNAWKLHHIFSYILGGKVDITQEVVKFVKLGSQCMERISIVVNTLCKFLCCTLCQNEYSKIFYTEEESYIKGSWLLVY